MEWIDDSGSIGDVYPDVSRFLTDRGWKPVVANQIVCFVDPLNSEVIPILSAMMIQLAREHNVKTPQNS